MTSRLMFELEAKGQEEGTHELKKRLAVTKQLMIGRFMLKIDGDGPVCASLFGCSLLLDSGVVEFEDGVHW
jgi:hypothetical protein